MAGARYHGVVVEAVLAGPRNGHLVRGVADNLRENTVLDAVPSAVPSAVIPGR